MKNLVLILIFITSIYANNEEKYTKLFSYLQEKQIVLGEDVTLLELFELNEKGQIYRYNGELNLHNLNEQFSSIIKKKGISNENLDSSNLAKQKNVNITDRQYAKLFTYLEANGVRLENDIKVKELYEMKEKGELFLNSGELNLNKLNKRLNIVLQYREEEKRRLHEELGRNNSRINKEVKRYIDENNRAVEEAQEKLKQNSNDSDNWFVKTINSILEMLKQ